MTNNVSNNTVLQKDLSVQIILINHLPYRHIIGRFYGTCHFQTRNTDNVTFTNAKRSKHSFPFERNGLKLFLNEAEFSLNSVNLVNHCCMNWSQFKDRVSCQIFACEVVTPWSLTQEVPGSNIFLQKCCY